MELREKLAREYADKIPYYQDRKANAAVKHFERLGIKVEVGLKGRGMCYYPGINWYVPNENENALRALCKLLICRNAWWTQLGWKPDWENDDDKYCIYANDGHIVISILNMSNRVLAFPTKEIADEFRVAFRDLIEEANELL